MNAWLAANWRKILGHLVFVLLVIGGTYIYVRFTAYFYAMDMWRANWHDLFENTPVHRHYIETMQQYGVDPLLAVPPPPTFWGSPLQGADYFVWGATSVMALGMFTIMKVLSERLYRY